MVIVPWDDPEPSAELKSDEPTKVSFAWQFASFPVSTIASLKKLKKSNLLYLEKNIIINKKAHITKIYNRPKHEQIN